MSAPARRVALTCAWIALVLGTAVFTDMVGDRWSHTSGSLGCLCALGGAGTLAYWISLFAPIG